jgi:hypothetical protein
MKTRTSWKPGHVSLHDLAAAGRKSRKVSQWGRVPFSTATLKAIRLERIKRAAEKS